RRQRHLQRAPRRIGCGLVRLPDRHDSRPCLARPPRVCLQRADQLLGRRQAACRSVLRRSGRALRLLQALALEARRAAARLPVVRVHHCRAHRRSALMADVVIFGAGDIARLAHYYFTHDSIHRVVAFTVDPSFRGADSFLDLPLVGFDEVSSRYPPNRYSMFVAMSYAKMNHVRADKYGQARRLGYTLVSYLSSRCTWLADQPPGDNCFVLEDNTVQPFVRIGSDVTLWSGNHIGHDASIGDHCFVSSHVVVSGHVRIEPYCFIGVNATLRNSLPIGTETLIGAGALVMKDTAAKSVYVPERTEVFPRTSDKVPL